MDYDYHSKLFDEKNDDIQHNTESDTNISTINVSYEENFNILNNRLDNIEKNMQFVQDKIATVEVQLDIIIKILNKDVKQNCEKMKNHIDFVENVYDNVKNPLGYLCNKLNFFAKDDNYQLHDNDNNNNLLSYDGSSNVHCSSDVQ